LVFVVLFVYLINKSAKDTLWGKRIASIVTLQGIRG
jgi:hypothetical protein